MIPTHITIGQIRFDGLTIDTEDGFKLVMTVSLVSEESAALRATPVDSHLRG
jgi:hypothetical protein